MRKIKVSKEEKELMESIEKDEWVEVENIEKEKLKYKQYASATLKKNKRINIRISSIDLDEFQKKAFEEGLPYQTLITSVLHKYISGRLTDTP